VEWIEIKDGDLLRVHFLPSSYEDFSYNQNFEEVHASIFEGFGLLEKSQIAIISFS